MAVRALQERNHSAAARRTGTGSGLTRLNLPRNPEGLQGMNRYSPIDTCKWGPETLPFKAGLPAGLLMIVVVEGIRAIIKESFLTSEVQ